MSQNNTTPPSPQSGHREKYIFETEIKRFEIDSYSEKGSLYRNLSTGPEKIKFLIENGLEVTKETDGRIMQLEKEAWRFYNEEQIEYIFQWKMPLDLRRSLKGSARE